MTGIENWIEKLKKAEKTCLLQDGRRKIHYTFPDKTELAEEYNVQTGELLIRKWRKKSTLGATLPWEFEVGQAMENPIQGSETCDIRENSNNPIFTRQDTISSFQWRIRNMFYSSDNYFVELDEQQRSLIVKTKNKKYYKKFTIPDMERIGMGLNSKSLSYSHANNTLIITYMKPSEFINMEKLISAELSKTKASKDGDVECNPS
ncbi:hypothetical protein BpHYR1_042112 [Brachionus plicatilis]|uniref:Protein DPCD n=1 Tax=Brachionus plicatilis TaxID=10195 RepID=A0A3M7R2B2_BRAPC|nr:hypothetical protein BpHYR1_042112 [Brachionus plicatilis]